MEYVKVTRNSVIIDEGFSSNAVVRLALIDEIIAKRLPVKQVAKALKLKERAVQTQVSNRKANKHLYSSVGRPPILDEIGEQSLLSELVDTSKDFKGLVLKAMNETLLRRNKLPAAKVPHHSTIVELKKKIGIRVSKGQATAPARQPAPSDGDIRDYVSVAVMHEAMSENMNPEMIFNFDTTAYATNRENEWVVCHHGINDKSPATRVDNSGLNLLVKSYFYHNAEGDIAPLVFFVYDDTMVADTIDVHRCPGGSCYGVGGPPGWIVFANTREGSQVFYDWFLRMILVPFVNKVRQVYRAMTYMVGDYDASAYIQCDGDQQQIDVIEGEDVQSLLRDNYITVGKLPVSCSSATRGSNACPFFKASKARLKNLTSDKWDSRALRSRVELIVDTHKFAAEKKKHLIDGILKVIAISRLVITATFIKNSYSAIGLCPFDQSAILRGCSAEEHAAIAAAMPNLVAIFKECGQLTEDEMTEQGIPIGIVAVGNQTEKQGEALFHQRAVNLTHAATCERYAGQAAERRKSKPEVNDPTVSSIVNTTKEGNVSAVGSDDDEEATDILADFPGNNSLGRASKYGRTQETEEI